MKATLRPMTAISILTEGGRIFVAVLLTGWSLCALQAQNGEPSADPAGAAAVSSIAINSQGLRPDHIWSSDYLHLVWSDTSAIVSAPVHWDQQQWLEVTAAVSAIVTTAAFDRPIRDHIQARRTVTEDRFMNSCQNFNTLYLLGGFEVWGELGGDVHAKNVAMDGIAASIIASGLITPAVKFVVGRERPNKTSATFKFKPFSGNSSFPSGHATQAFAVATAISENYPGWWVEGITYGSAALIGYARIEQNAHYASDVVVGALIGWSVARAVVHRHNGPPDPRRLSWSPYTNGSASGLVFYKSF